MRCRNFVSNKPGPFKFPNHKTSPNSKRLFYRRSRIISTLMVRICARDCDLIKIVKFLISVNIDKDVSIIIKISGKPVDGWKTVHPHFIFTYIDLRIDVLIQNTHPLVGACFRGFG